MIEGFYASPRWTYELPDCSLPLTFDQYSNCSYNCLYCFAQYQRTGIKGVAHAAKEVRPVDVARVKRIWERAPAGEFGPYIASGRAFQWGGMGDPFCGFERRFGVGLDLLRFFRERDAWICFSTKGTWWTEDERYVELFRGNPRWNVKVSIITLDEQKAAGIERGVPSPVERLRAIERIASWGGGGATLRLRPFLFGVSNPSHVDLIGAAADAGATALSTEFWCMERRSLSLRAKLPAMNRIARCDLGKLYAEQSRRQGLLRLNREFKRPFVDEMEAAARARGVRFYVSDYDFKERCDNGSCCGLPPEWPYQRGQFTEALLVAKARGEVRWRDIAAGFTDWATFQAGRGSNCQLFRSTSEKRARFVGMTMAEGVHWIWNNPTAGSSPYQMFSGVLRPDRLDEEGDVIYVYDPSRT